jgi:hypothetical protein
VFDKTDTSSLAEVFVSVSAEASTADFTVALTPLRSASHVFNSEESEIINVKLKMHQKIQIVPIFFSGKVIDDAIFR